MPSSAIQACVARAKAIGHRGATAGVAACRTGEKTPEAGAEALMRLSDEAFAAALNHAKKDEPPHG